MPDPKRFIAARIALLENQERYLLEQALKAPDPHTAARYEYAAQTVHEDAEAIYEEHELDS
jgi:hypothetical protein